MSAVVSPALGTAQFSEWTPNAIRVLESRYLNREDGKIVETPDELVWRVARHVASAERLFDDPTNDDEVDALAGRFFEMMRGWRFMPNSPTLMNAGRRLGQLGACFVLNIQDSIESIMEAHSDTAMIQRSGGGVGYCLDELRPSGEIVQSSGGTTSGPLSFWRSLSAVTSAIQQGAFRRGANMMMMEVTAPDILKFIHVKQNLAQFTNYNISIKVADAFMHALRQGGTQAHRVYNFKRQQWYVIPRSVHAKVVAAVAAGTTDQMQVRDVDNCYGVSDLHPIASPAQVPPGDWVSVGDIWNMICDQAWKTGEPGICFIDRIRESEPTPHIGTIKTSNPCSEQFLLGNEMCTLASINLASFLPPPEGDDLFTPMERFDWDAFEAVIRDGVWFLDNVLQINKYPTAAIEKLTLANRKIGLGVMGVADLLFRAGVQYDSDEGVSLFEDVMRRFQSAAMAASVSLAERRGVFQNWHGSRWEKRGVRLRNADVTTVAPTGTISIISDCSCGIEPMFSLVFQRNVLEGQQLLQADPFFERTMRLAGCWSDDVAQEAFKHGSIQHIPAIPDTLKRVFRCAHDVSPIWHINMQAAAQRNVSNGVSKTCNLPSDATVDDVRDVFMRAWNLGCKSTTVYRDGCRANQPMALSSSEKPEEKPVIAPVAEYCDSKRIRVELPSGTLHVHISIDEHNRPVEVFAHLGHSGGNEMADLEAICRLSSLLLRSGHDLDLLIRHLGPINVATQSCAEISASSLPQGIAKALLIFLQRRREEAQAAPKSVVELIIKNNGNGNGRDNGHARSVDRLSRMFELPVGYKFRCPQNLQDCDGFITREGTCFTCRRCGASSCL